nr:HepT-like ribonuclease domain-containing protein [uncultured Rhodoblastus sp.]
MWRDDALVLDIVLASKDARDFAGDMDFPAFLGSRLHQNAVIRALEIIGEAAGKLSVASRKFHGARSSICVTG